VTQFGQQNHYDIKYLHGYGSQVSVKNQRIVLKNGIDVFTKKQEIEEFVPTGVPYSRIVLGKDGYVSNKAIQLLSDNHVSLIFLDSFGNFKACLHEIMSSFTGSKRRMAQYDTFRDPEKVLHLQKELVKAKLQSEIDFVKDNNVKSKLKRFQEFVSNAKSYKEIISHEAKAGIIYRNYYVGLFDPKYEFTQRKNDGRRSKPRYATNIINALLNYGFSVLYSEIAKNINGEGLDAYYGFYHKSHESEQALVYDLVEPYRVLVESAVLEFSQTEPRWNRLGKCYKLDEKHHFQIILDVLTIKRFLETLSRKLNEKRMYVSRYGNRGKSTEEALTRESTIIKLKIENLIEFCLTNRNIQF
jgi:CRISPR-associated protein Cas1